MIPSVSIPLGLVLLVGGADLLVRGSVWVALRLGMQPIVVGLTLVAFGTSAPELFASLTAASKGAVGMDLGVVLGSNLANIGLILGIAALVRPVFMEGRVPRIELKWMLAFSLAMGLPFLWPGVVDWRLGSLFIVALLLFVGQLLRAELNRARAMDRTADGTPAATPEVPAEISTTRGAALFHILAIPAGLAGLKFGGDFVVDGATSIAQELGVSDLVIGMTVVGVGTSLPELAASVVAASKGHPEICVGNVIGSNIFNAGMVLGITGCMSPIAATWPSEAGWSMVAGLAFTVTLVAVLGIRQRIPRAVGLLWLLSYALFTTWLVWSAAG